MQVKTAIESRNILGEGPWWSVDEQVLYWIDIKKPSLQRWNPETKEHKFWSMPAEIGCFVSCTPSRGVVALQNGIAFVDLVSNGLEKLMDPEEDLPDNRFNDGICDRRGRFWVGSMDNNEVDITGSLYCIDTDRSIRKIKSGVGISNGLGWSPDDRIMYFADSTAKCIYAFDYDIDTGAATNERLFVDVDRGVPDGLTVDSEGYVWSAQWGAWRVVRYAPDGTVDQILDVPAKQPTSCMFGGADLRDLYITSARIKLTDEEIAAQPEAGNVFVVRTNVSGLPETRFPC